MKFPGGKWGLWMSLLYPGPLYIKHPNWIIGNSCISRRQNRSLYSSIHYNRRAFISVSCALLPPYLCTSRNNWANIKLTFPKTTFSWKHKGACFFSCWAKSCTANCRKVPHYLPIYILTMDWFTCLPTAQTKENETNNNNNTWWHPIGVRLQPSVEWEHELKGLGVCNLLAIN